jgi:hypothetical protein
MRKKAILKFNNGRLALLCNKCHVIIKIGSEFNEEERLFSIGKGKLPPQYCNNCKNLKT